MADPKDLASAIERLDAARVSLESDVAAADELGSSIVVCERSDLRTVLDAIKELRTKDSQQ